MCASFLGLGGVVCRFSGLISIFIWHGFVEVEGGGLVVACLLNVLRGGS